MGVTLAAAVGSMVVAAGPAMASTGEVVVASATYTGIDVATQPDGGTVWTVQQAGAGLYGSPSVAIASNGTIVVAAVELGGADRGTLYYFWEAAGSTSWQRQQVSAIGAAALYVTPSIAGQKPVAAGTPINIVIVDQDQNDTGSTYYWEAFGSRTWSSEAIPSGGVATDPYITEDANNTGVIAYGTADGFGFDRLKYNTTSTWESIQDIDVGTPMTSMEAVDEPSGRIVASGMTANSGLMWEFYNASGATAAWYGQDLSVFGFANVSMAVDTAARNITVVAYDPTMVSGECVTVYTEKSGTTSWSEQTRAECPGWAGPANVAASAQPNGNLVMTLIASNQQVQFYWAPSGTDNWNNEYIPLIIDPIDAAAIAAD